MHGFRLSNRRRKNLSPQIESPMVSLNLMLPGPLVTTMRNTYMTKIKVWEKIIH
jgi:hypothetical protein